MPFLTAPPAIAEVRPAWEMEEVAYAHGAEGRLVEEHLRSALRHWNERTEAVLQADDLPDDELDYAPGPPQASFRIQTRYEFRGVGRPPQIDIELD